MTLKRWCFVLIKNVIDWAWFKTTRWWSSDKCKKNNKVNRLSSISPHQNTVYKLPNPTKTIWKLIKFIDKTNKKIKKKYLSPKKILIG